MILMGTSGPLGRYIDLPPALTICIRCLIAAFLLGFFCRLTGVTFLFANRRDFWRTGLVGVILVLHWTTYFMALQLANVAIGMLSLFTYPMITALLEPVFLKTKLQPIHLLFGAMGILGVSFLVPSISIENEYLQGALMGMLSAFLYALRNLILKPIVGAYSPLQSMFYQLLVGGLVLSPLLLWADFEAVMNQWEAILLLSVITTAVGHTMFVKVLNNFSVTAMSVMTTIQPIYGIIMGMIFLAEIPALRSVIGGLIILTTVVLESIRSYRRK